MKATKPKTETRNKASAGIGSEKSRLLKEFFLNASLLAVMKETVEESVYLERLARALAREEDENISAPAA